MRLHICGTCLFLSLVTYAVAAPLSLTALDTQSLSADVTYQIWTTGSGSNPINPGQTGYGPHTDDPYSVTSGVFTFSLISPLLLGTTANSALLDLSFSFVGLMQTAVPWSVTSSDPSDWGYAPVFSSTASGQFIAIQSGAVVHTFAPNTSSVTDLDLLALGFGPPLAAGGTLDIHWSGLLTFTADNSAYSGFCKNCRKVFSVSASHELTPTAQLDLGGSQWTTTGVPEPAVNLLVGAGLLLLGWCLRNRRRA